MAGKKGQKWSRAMTQQQRDAISLSKIENYLDQHIDGEILCPECKGKYPAHNVPKSVVAMMRMRYDKLRPTLAATTSEVRITNYGDALERIGKQYEVGNAALLGPDPAIPASPTTDEDHAIH